MAINLPETYFILLVYLSTGGQITSIELSTDVHLLSDQWETDTTVFVYSGTDTRASEIVICHYHVTRKIT
jgi:hypothetical protein